MKPVSVTSNPVMASVRPLVPTRTIVTNSFASTLASNKPTKSILGKLPLDQTRPSPSTPPPNPLPPSTLRVQATKIPPFQTLPILPSVHPNVSTTDQPRALKRRLGMGRVGTGYSNKKFKTPGM